MQAKKLSINAPVVPAQWLTLGERFCHAALMATIVVLAAWLGWGLARGLELTDEAFYVLSGMHPHALRFFFTPTQWLAAPLWAIGGGLTGFRLVGWLILTVSAVLLACGAIRAARWAGAPVPESRLPVGVAITGSIVGAWLYGAVLNFSPSYNSLSAAGAYSALGLILLAADRPDRGAWKFLPILIGVVLGITVLAKFSTGICMLGIVLGLHAFIYGSLRIIAIRVAMLLSASVLTVLVFASLFTTPVEAWHAFLSGLALTSLAQQSEPVLVRIARNWEECKALFDSAVHAGVGPLFCVALSLLVRRPVVAIVAAAWLAVDLARGDLLLGGMDRYLSQTVPLAATMVAMLLLTIEAWARRARMALLVGMLFTLPFLIALGTGNPLPFQIVLSMAPWGLLCALLAGSVPGDWRLPALLFSVIFVAIAATQTISAGLRSPYRLARPLTEQTIDVDLVRLGHLKVDAQTSRFIEDVNAMRQRCGVRDDMHFLGFYGLPGLALALNAIPVDTPWLFGEPFASAVLAEIDPRSIKAALVAVRVDSNGVKSLPPALLDHFPEDYRNCGTATLPFESVSVELWAPNLPNDMDGREK